MAESKGIPVDRAAKLLGRSPETVHRWIKDGKLPPGITAHKGTIDGHEQWLIDMSDAPSNDSADGPSWRIILAAKDDEIATLKAELAATQERLREAHVLLGQKQLEGPGHRRWWSVFQFWKR